MKGIPADDWAPSAAAVDGMALELRGNGAVGTITAGDRHTDGIVGQRTGRQHLPAGCPTSGRHQRGTWTISNNAVTGATDNVPNTANSNADGIYIRLGLGFE